MLKAGYHFPASLYLTTCQSLYQEQCVGKTSKMIDRKMSCGKPKMP